MEARETVEDKAAEPAVASPFPGLGKVKPGLSAHAAFVEECMVRPWPGNVRELRAEVKRAGRDAVIDGRDAVEPKDLDPSAGVRFSGVPEPARAARSEAPEKDQIERTLDEEGGNVSRAAKALGLHRNQLYRLMERYGVEPKRSP
jgi:DNA-binding NtrC family response regulator